MDGLDWNTIINTAINNGWGLVVTIYFLARDWVFQRSLTEMLGKLSETMGHVEEFVKGGRRDD